MRRTSVGPVPLPLITATTYLTPLREGGSLPGLVEADDSGTYVVKFTGAGQGTKALVAEIVVGELGRRLGIPVPDLALIEIDPEIGRREPDEEVQDLLNASPGLNLAIDFLPGSVGYDRGFDHRPGRHRADPLAGRVRRQRRPQCPQHQPADLAPHAVGDRPRRVPALPPCLGLARGVRPVALQLRRPRARPAGPTRGGCTTGSANGSPPTLLDEVLDLVPDAWLLPDPDRPDPNAPADPARGPGGLPDLPGDAAGRRRTVAAVSRRYAVPVRRAACRPTGGPRRVRQHRGDPVLPAAGAAPGRGRSGRRTPPRARPRGRPGGRPDAAQATVSACRDGIGSARENTGLATRFGMLVAPRSTVVQPSPVHAGISPDPDQTLIELMGRLVGPARADGD